jgi:glucokinase
VIWCSIDVAAIPSEGGHQSFPPETSIEHQITASIIQENWVSYEQLLSGKGLQRLYNFFSQRRQAPNVHELAPADIVNQFNSGNIIAREALEAFALALGTFCGNMVLALGATRGVYLWGGILREFPMEILRNNMMVRFNRRGFGAVSSYLASVPVYKITSDQIGLRGCSVFADKYLTKNIN